MLNDDIVSLHSGGVSKEIITKKIQYSDTKFDLSTAAMLDLKAAKVPEAIVKVMMVPKRAALVSNNPNLIAGTLPPHPENLPVPSRGRFAEPGFYYEVFQPRVSYEQLEPTTSNQTKTGSAGQSVLRNVTGGLTTTDQTVGLANKSANAFFEDNRPVFYLVFSGARKNMDDAAESIFSGVSSPNDFVLMRAQVSGRGREVTIGRQSDYTTESGFSKGAVPFRYKKISAQLYKIYFEQDVSAGEYVFIYNKGSEFSSSLKLYDFSLQNNTK